MIYFTRQEQRIIILLAIIMLIGTGVLLVKRFKPGWIMRVTMGKADFDVEKDQKSPRLTSNSLTPTDQPAQKPEPDQAAANDESASTSIDPLAQKREPSPGLEVDESTPDDQIVQDKRPDQAGKLDVALVVPVQKSGVDINTASKEDLEGLSGIGPVLAQRIIDYRQEHGKFRSIYELTSVKGIGSGTLQKFEDLVTVGDPDETE